MDSTSAKTDLSTRMYTLPSSSVSSQTSKTPEEDDASPISREEDSRKLVSSSSTTTAPISKLQQIRAKIKPIKTSPPRNSSPITTTSHKRKHEESQDARWVDIKELENGSSYKVGFSDSTSKTLSEADVVDLVKTQFKRTKQLPFSNKRASLEKEEEPLERGRPSLERARSVSSPPETDSQAKVESSPGSLFAMARRYTHPGLSTSSSASPGVNTSTNLSPVSASSLSKPKSTKKKRSSPSSSKGKKSKPASKSSTFHGVSWHTQRRRWRAYVYLSPGRQKYLGTFESQREAALAYDRAVVRYGLRSPLNFASREEKGNIVCKTEWVSPKAGPALAGNVPAPLNLPPVSSAPPSQLSVDFLGPLKQLQEQQQQQMRPYEPAAMKRAISQPSPFTASSSSSVASNRPPQSSPMPSQASNLLAFLQHQKEQQSRNAMLQQLVMQQQQQTQQLLASTYPGLLGQASNPTSYYSSALPPASTTNSSIALIQRMLEQQKSRNAANNL